MLLLLLLLLCVRVKYDDDGHHKGIVSKASVSTPTNPFKSKKCQSGTEILGQVCIPKNKRVQEHRAPGNDLDFQDRGWMSMTSHRMSIRDLRDRVPIAVLEGVLGAIVQSFPSGGCLEIIHTNKNNG